MMSINSERSLYDAPDAVYRSYQMPAASQLPSINQVGHATF